MPVETFDKINSLNPANPPASDGLVQGDDHIRGIKSTIVNTFPNIDGEVDITDEQLNVLATKKYNMAAGSIGAPAIYDDAETALGFYRISAGKWGFTGALDIAGKLTVSGGNADTGEVRMYLGRLTMPPGFYEMNGQTRPRTDPLFTAANDAGLVGTVFGVGDGSTTYTLPDERGRFPRARSASITQGTQQASQNKAHTHSVTGTTNNTGAHTHGVTDPGHAHTYVRSVGIVDNTGATALVGGADNTQSTSTATTGVSINSGGAHEHTVAGTTDENGGTEARPDAFAVIMAIYVQ